MDFLAKEKQLKKEVPTPAYVVDEEKLRKNLEILAAVEKEAGCHILLAQKAFSMYATYPLIGRYISGTTASGLYEALLSHEEMGKENHVYAPAYKEEDMESLVQICDHISFNSLSQWAAHAEMIAAYKKRGASCFGKEAVMDLGEPTGKVPSIGIRINPQCSTQEGHEIYDPCGKGSRLGVTYAEFQRQCERLGFTDILDDPHADVARLLQMQRGEIVLTAEDIEARNNRQVIYELPEEIEGLHFHTLCEQNSDDLVTTFKAFEEKFAPYLRQVKWLNLGGGHHISRADYNIQALVDLIRYIKDTYQVEVYLEPGEAIALDAGYLVTEVLDIVHNDMDILILDASAACHMPDVLEMPYRPPLHDAGEPGEKPYTYRLSSMTCLAGDVIGDYSFDAPIRLGDKLIFKDMAIYSMVKNNTFNGIPLPSIYLLKEDGEVEAVRKFSYEDFKSRL